MLVFERLRRTIDWRWKEKELSSVIRETFDLLWKRYVFTLGEQVADYGWSARDENNDWPGRDYRNECFNAVIDFVKRDMNIKEPSAVPKAMELIFEMVPGTTWLDRIFSRDGTHMYSGGRHDNSPDYYEGTARGTIIEKPSISDIIYNRSLRLEIIQKWSSSRRT